jgi:hypothetical protein
LNDTTAIDCHQLSVRLSGVEKRRWAWWRRETCYRVDTLLARLMDNIPVLATPADTLAPSQSHEAGAQAPAEATPTPAPGHHAPHRRTSQLAEAIVPGVDIAVGDWLEDSKGQTRLFVADVDHISDLSGGSPSHIEVLYETRIEYEHQESSAQVAAMLDDIADAVWTLSDKKMPPEKKEHVRALVRELQGIVKSLPPGVAGGLAGEIAARFVDGS